jgi:hypothetical protein
MTLEQECSNSEGLVKSRESTFFCHSGESRNDVLKQLQVFYEFVMFWSLNIVI